MYLALTRIECLPNSILIELQIWRRRCHTSLVIIIHLCLSSCIYLLFLFLLVLSSFGRRIGIGGFP